MVPAAIEIVPAGNLCESGLGLFSSSSSNGSDGFSVKLGGGGVGGVGVHPVIGFGPPKYQLIIQRPLFWPPGAKSRQSNEPKTPR